MATITPILMPFAEARIDNVQPSTTPSLSVANQPDGFPLYQKLPYGDANYTPVKEEEMNGVLNFYTNILYQLGQGLFFTFDANLAAATGGYAQGAVLWCESNQTFQISLIDNNLANFVTTPSYINDGINWQSITQYPSIYNPTNNNCVITGTSTVNTDWQAVMSMTQESSGAMTNKIGAVRMSGLLEQVIAYSKYQILPDLQGIATGQINLMVSKINNVNLSYQLLLIGGERPYLKSFTTPNTLSQLTIQNDSLSLIGDVQYVQKAGMDCIITKMANGALKYECWGNIVIPYNQRGGTHNLPFDNTDISYSVSATAPILNNESFFPASISISKNNTSFSVQHSGAVPLTSYDLYVPFTLIGIQFTS